MIVLDPFTLLVLLLALAISTRVIVGAIKGPKAKPRGRAPCTPVYRRRVWR